MDHSVAITLSDGTELVFEQDQIFSPKFNCDCYFGSRPGDYVKRIAEFGITVQSLGEDGEVTYRHISAHCMCNIEFTLDC